MMLALYFPNKEQSQDSCLETAPVDSVDANYEGLDVGVGGAAELEAGLSAERRAVT